MARALLLINPNSRNGRADIEAALQILRRSDIELVLPDDSADLDTVFASVRENLIDMVIVGGGDGTLNRFVEDVLALGRPLGILPLGTANDLARTLGLPESLEACAEVIAARRKRPIDLGRVNGKHFFNVASLGVSEQVTKELNRDLKARFGIFGYAIGLWRAVTRRRVIKGKIACDGRPFRLRAIQISIGNGRFYGGGMAIHADAAIDDGTLDLVMMEQRSVWQLFLALPAFRFGRHDLNENVRHMRARRIELETRTPLPINTDGEITSETPATFELVPSALEVFAPSPAV